MLISNACDAFECAKNIPICLQNTYASIKLNIFTEFLSENLEKNVSPLRIIKPSHFWLDQMGNQFPF